MKKLKLNLSGAKELTRTQQRSINGGSGDFGDEIFATCSAECLDMNGNEYSVSCAGTKCEATAYVGCKSDEESQNC